MPAQIISAPVTADVGDTLRVWLAVCDDDGIGSAATVTGTLTNPAGVGTAFVVAAQSTVGLYEATVDVAVAGQHTAVITVTSTDFGDDVLTFTVHVRATSGTIPTLADVLEYLGEDSSATPQEVQDALDAETAAQSRRCTIPADYPDDLAQALKRRVARNLAARAVPVASFTSFEGGGTSSRVPQRDVEVVRLEGPFRRRTVG